MAATKIIGVDFSGAKHDQNTWIAECQLTAAGALVLDDVRPIRRDALCELLMGIVSPAVVGMDFPFGVPTELAISLDSQAKAMPEVWRRVNCKDLGWFESKCKEVVDKNGGQPKRRGDERYTESISPLNIRMIPMTFHGMKMLHKLWTETNCQVPPLDCAGRNGPVLLEVMPGAALRSRHLPYQEYKNNKGSDPLQNLRNRREILAKLWDIFGIALLNFQDYRDLFVFNDDALDSFIVAIAAALWVKNPCQFHHPQMGNELAAARQEGWLYAPKPIIL